MGVAKPYQNLSEQLRSFGFCMGTERKGKRGRKIPACSRSREQWPMVASSPRWPLGRAEDVASGSRLAGCPWVVSSSWGSQCIFWVGAQPQPSRAVRASRQHWAGLSLVWMKNILSRTKQWLAGLTAVLLPGTGLDHPGFLISVVRAWTLTLPSFPF